MSEFLDFSRALEWVPARPDSRLTPAHNIVDGILDFKGGI
jgi:hypothetical protein